MLQTSSEEGLSLQGSCADQPGPRDPAESCLILNRKAEGNPLYASSPDGVYTPHGASHLPWRISPEPFCVSAGTFLFLKSLGHHLLAFYQAANKLYLDSARGTQPGWVADYLDRGKPQALVEFQRMNRQKRLLPGIIRPDLVFTDHGRPIACELDSVPGGQGFVASMAADYSELGFSVVGGATGILDGFERMIRSQVPEVGQPLVVVTVSQEANDYWNEISWVARSLREAGRLDVHVVRPEELRYVDDGLYLGPRRVDVVYRFFELFDLKNVPKTELVMYAAKKQQVVVTPPFKAFLEEKMLFALFHHPALREFWQAELSPEAYQALVRILPRTWIVDPRPLPPHAVIPDLKVGDRPVTDWRQLVNTTKKQRDYVLKPSGFSELAWGSRGISFGSDLPAEEWALRLEEALERFEHTPYLLQEYHKPARVKARYYDFNRGEVRAFEGRARLCPYYYVEGDQAHLHGILVTVAPADKKAIHGMTDAIMVPAMVEGA